MDEFIKTLIDQSIEIIKIKEAKRQAARQAEKDEIKAEWDEMEFKVREQFAVPLREYVTVHRTGMQPFWQNNIEGTLQLPECTRISFLAVPHYGERKYRKLEYIKAEVENGWWKCDEDLSEAIGRAALEYQRQQAEYEVYEEQEERERLAEERKFREQERAAMHAAGDKMTQAPTPINNDYDKRNAYISGALHGYISLIVIDILEKRGLI